MLPGVGEAMNKLLHILILLISCISFSYAEIYKWVDDNGQVHYSEKPPVRQKAEQIQIQSTGNHSAPQRQQVDEENHLKKQQKLLKAFEEERQYNKKQEAKNEKIEATRSRNCVIAKSNLRSYETANRIFKIDENGNRVYMPDSSRQQAIQRARDEVERWCTN